MAEWPADWDERKRGKDCPMCASGRPEETDFGIRVKAAERSDAYLFPDDQLRDDAAAIRARLAE